VKTSAYRVTAVGVKFIWTRAALLYLGAFVILKLRTNAVVIKHREHILIPVIGFGSSLHETLNVMEI
jgi:hypothetical protein